MFRALVSSGKARIVAVTLAVAVAALLLAQAGGPTRASHAGGMDAMSIDMDPSATPANTPTSIGSIQSCARINENGIMDADEDSIDTLRVDVLADNIPASNPMHVFTYMLGYSAGNVSVQLQLGAGGLLNTAPSSSVVNASDPLPDSDGTWFSLWVDEGPFPDSYETGSGYLDKLFISSEPGAVAGEYPLTLGGALHGGPLGDFPPDAINNATVAINQPCAGGGATPTATATATATPTPTATATPTATPAGGDADGDTVPDGPDTCPNWPNPGQGYPPWPVPGGDPDCDGFPSASESTITTLPLVHCGTNAWPPDFDDSMLVDITDVLTLKLPFGGAVPPYPARLDISPSGLIDISDVLSLKPFFGASC